MRKKTIVGLAGFILGGALTYRLVTEPVYICKNLGSQEFPLGLEKESLTPEYQDYDGLISFCKCKSLTGEVKYTAKVDFVRGSGRHLISSNSEMELIAYLEDTDGDGHFDEYHNDGLLVWQGISFAEETQERAKAEQALEKTLEGLNL